MEFPFPIRVKLLTASMRKKNVGRFCSTLKRKSVTTRIPSSVSRKNYPSIPIQSRSLPRKSNNWNLRNRQQKSIKSLLKKILLSQSCFNRWKNIARILLKTSPALFAERLRTRIVRTFTTLHYLKTKTSLKRQLIIFANCRSN